MEYPTKLTIENLFNTYTKYDEAMKSNPELVSMLLGLSIVKHFLGEAWISENLDPNASKQSFMTIDLVITNDANKKAFRIVDLGELLFNLQGINGFNNLIDRMRTAEPEACLAELHVGRLLYINDTNFRFVTPQNIATRDYDLEITYPDGQVVNAETKCKIETTQLTKNTIDNVLRSAKTQLPKDQPGILFVKIPQQWLEIKSSAQMMVETADKFLRGTRRIVLIVYYSEPLISSEGIISQGHRFKEISNPNNRFDTTKDWKLLDYKPLSVSWNALPEKWVRLVNFPGSISKL